jgi:Amiloride-sensitive sodium channel
MSVVLYLDDFDHPSTRDGCCPNEVRSQSSGIRISVQDRSTPTDMPRGIAVAPGTEATIVLQESDRIRLEAPYGDCTTRTSLGDPTDNLKYSVHGCQQICEQNRV